MVRLLSNSGERRGVRAASAALAFLVASSLRCLGETSPTFFVVLFGFLPSFGRVDACRCFLPNRFVFLAANYCLIPKRWNRIAIRLRGPSVRCLQSFGNRQSFR